MKAQDLRKALNLFDPEQALRSDEELEHFYVPRPNSPIEDLAIQLPDSERPQKILFTGHRGSGKSTELARLRQRLEDDFLIVHYSIKSVLNLFDLTYVDVVLSLGLELIRKVQKYRTYVRDEVIEHVLSFANEITYETSAEHGQRVEAGADLSVWVARVSSRLQTEDRMRTTVREKTQSRLSDLFENIEHLAKSLERASGKRLLVIVEDLDKTDLDVAKQLFYGHATSLLAPPVSIIYTFPTPLRHDNDFIQIRTSFPNLCVLPNMKTRHRDGSVDEDGLGGVRDVVRRRIEPELIEDDALTLLAELSGGIPRELVALVRQACLEARKAGDERIDVEHVKRAGQRRRTDYEVLLSDDQRKRLRVVAERKTVNNDAAHRDLLYNLSVLEYQNSHVWYDVHPLVRSLIEADAS